MVFVQVQRPRSEVVENEIHALRLVADFDPRADRQSITEPLAQPCVILHDGRVIVSTLVPLAGVRIEVLGEGDAGQPAFNGRVYTFSR